MFCVVLEVACNLSVVIGILQLSFILHTLRLNVCHQRKEIYNEHCREGSQDGAQLADLRIPDSKASSREEEDKVKEECLWQCK